jgi:hypothetical protein
MLGSMTKNALVLWRLRRVRIGYSLSTPLGWMVVTVGSRMT